MRIPPRRRRPVCNLRRTGPGAFAALGEAVEIWSADPSTDWSKVDVEALRAHLSTWTMSSFARAATEKLPNGARFRTGPPDVVVDPKHDAQSLQS
jgi:hypothetical protein